MRIQFTSATVESCVFVGNRSTAGAGGAFYLEDWFGADTPPSVVRNCTFVLNEAPEAGAIVNSGHNLLVENTVIHNCGIAPVVNAPAPGQTPPDEGITIHSSNIEGGWNGPGSGNIDVDPIFVSPTAGDWRLAPGSPCIDAGDTDLLGSGEQLDVAGRPRVIGAGVDMGAHEFDSLCGADCAEPLDGVVDVNDLVAVVQAWGSASGPPDVTYDGAVDVADLIAVLLSWGACPR